MPYHHHHHNQQQQQYHHAPPPSSAHDGVDRRLPEGWVEVPDPNSGRLYYANPSTGETSWNRPQATAPPPAPAPLPPPPPPRQQQQQQFERQDYGYSNSNYNNHQYHEYQQQQQPQQYSYYDSSGEHRSSQAHNQSHQDHSSYPTTAAAAASRPMVGSHGNNDSYRQHTDQHHAEYESYNSNSFHNVNTTSVNEPPPPPFAHDAANSTHATTTTTTTTMSPPVQPPQQQPPSVLAARTVMDQLSTLSAQDAQRKELELQGLAAGQVADLCRLQREERPEDESTCNRYYYAPIDDPSASMSLQTTRTVEQTKMEPGRLDTRLRTFYDKVQRIG